MGANNMSVIAIKTAEGESTVKSGSLTASEHEILYVVSGARSRAEAFQTVDSSSPANVDDLVKKNLRFEKFTGNDMEISAIYGEAEKDPNDPGVLSSLANAKAKVSFDTSGGTQHIRFGKKLHTAYCPGETKYNPGLAIGWNGKIGQNSDISGVDIIVPNVRKTVAQTISRPSTTYENIVINLTGTVNSGKFLGRDEGEVLFLGASWSDDGGSYVDATYNFAIRKNEYIEQLGGWKEGWTYLWEIANTQKPSITGPFQIEYGGVFLSQVYTKNDFNKLGIRV